LHDTDWFGGQFVAAFLLLQAPNSARSRPIGATFTREFIVSPRLIEAKGPGPALDGRRPRLIGTDAHVAWE
jgi:hypothetical protein